MLLYFGDIQSGKVRSLDVVINGISSLEYWRLVGKSKVIVPQKTNVIVLPSNSSFGKLLPLAEHGVLSYPLHCLSASKQKRTRDSIQHFHPKPFIRGQIYAINKCVGLVSPEQTLLELSQYLSLPQVAGLMTEFCGTYTLADWCANGLTQRQPLSSCARLLSFSYKSKHAKGLANYRAALRFAMDNSRSPMETAVALLLTLPVRLGGYGIPKPKLNAPLALREQDRAHIGVEQLRPDMLWEDSRVCLEYDSASFHGDEARHTNDARRKNAFVNAGFKVITLTKTQLASVAEMNSLAASISKAVGHRLRLPDYQTHLKLRKELLGARSILRRQYQLSELLGQDMMYFDDGFGDANAECGLVDE